MCPRAPRPGQETAVGRAPRGARPTALVPGEQHRGLVQIDKHERAAAQRPLGRHPPITEVLEDLELIRARAIRLPNVQKREAADTPRRLLAVCAPHHRHQRETHKQDYTKGHQGGFPSHGAPSCYVNLQEKKHTLPVSSTLHLLLCLSLCIPRSISDMLLTIARFSVEPPVMRGRSHSHASSCLFVRDQKSGCASHFRPCWP